MNRRFLQRATLAVTLLLLVVGMGHAQNRAKYVFYFIGDGLGINQTYGTELYNAQAGGGDGRLSFTRFPVRTYVTNHSSSSAVTDSAAAATALATGIKTNNGYLGVDKEGEQARNIAEVAKGLGYATGVATNVGINHATPSGFYAHCKDRGDYTELCTQLFAGEMDFAAGATFLCRSRSGLKPQDMVARAREAGIEVVQSADKAAQVRGKRVILLSDSLSRKNLPFAIDRREGSESIVDFTDAAIRYLEREGDKGFLLMIEGGRIDYSCHDNDAVTTFKEVNDFDASIRLALDFYERHPDQTLIVVTSDHETGGMAVGYSKYKINFERLLHQDISMESLTGVMQRMREQGKMDWEDMQSLLKEHLGLWDKVSLREKDEKSLRKTFEKNFLNNGEKVVGLYTSNEKMAAEAIKILNKRAYIDWISLSHTGMQVPLWVKGVGYERFYECYDNTDIPKAIAEAMGTNLR
ncbi:MAG: alkaline phosphatase [Alistipes sp.]|nr:alkaline phosphatase [Alistipes sp.]